MNKYFIASLWFIVIIALITVFTSGLYGMVLSFLTGMIIVSTLIYIKRDEKKNY
jgi:hypothetical protein